MLMESKGLGTKFDKEVTGGSSLRGSFVMRSLGIVGMSAKDLKKPEAVRILSEIVAQGGLEYVQKVTRSSNLFARGETDSRGLMHKSRSLMPFRNT